MTEQRGRIPPPRLPKRPPSLGITRSHTLGPATLPDMIAGTHQRIDTVTDHLSANTTFVAGRLQVVGNDVTGFRLIVGKETSFSICCLVGKRQLAG